MEVHGIRVCGRYFSGGLPGSHCKSPFPRDYLETLPIPLKVTSIFLNLGHLTGIMGTFLHMVYLLRAMEKTKSLRQKITILLMV